MMHRPSPSPSEIRDPEQRKVVLAALAEAANDRELTTDLDEPVRIHDEGRARSGAQLRLRTRGSRTPQGQRRIRFYLHGAHFELVAQCRPEPERSSEVLATDLRLFSQNVRRTPRIDVRGLQVHLNWKARGRSGQGAVIDVSNHGMAVHFEPGQAPSEDLSLITADLQVGEQTFEGAARVLRHDAAADSTRVALSFSPVDDDMNIGPSLLTLRFPSLKERWQVDPAQMQDLMERSGYAALSCRTGVASSWLQLRQPELTQDRVYLSAQGEPVGHLSQTRAYSRTWVGHQLATLPGHPESVQAWLSLYRFGAALPLLVDGDEAMQIAYFDPTKRWHERFFSRFVRWMEDPKHSQIVRLDRFEVQSEGADYQGKVLGRPAREDELPLVTDLARARLGDLAAAALDVRCEQLRSACLQPAFEAAGMQRSREVVVLEHEGRVEAAALLERGSADVNAFGLFDMAQVFLARGRAPAPERLEGFMQYILQWYIEQGVPQPIFAAPEGSLCERPHPRLAKEETMGLMLWSAEGLRHYDNYLQFTFGCTQHSARRRGAFRNPKAEYEARVTVAREALVSSPSVQELLSGRLDETTFLAFLIEHASRSVAMTRPVESWIYRAGVRCEVMGLEAVCKDLKKHAKAEAGHDAMLVSDTAILVDVWNRRYPSHRMDAQALLSRPPTAANLAYEAMHEEVIRSDRPYRQVAIELEIERLSVSAGTGFLARAQELMGEAAHGLSFLSEHVRLDVGHTVFNEHLMERLLAVEPQAGLPLARTGVQALAIYQDFAEECLLHAKRVAQAIRRGASSEPLMAQGPLPKAG